MTMDFAQWTSACGSSLAIVLGAAVSYFLLAHGLKSLCHRHYLPEPLQKTVQRVGLWVIAIGTGLLLLQVMGILHSVIAAATGVFALFAIGFVAVWSVLSNALCSFILMIIRPFRVGDTLAFPPDELRGKVVNFNLIFTTLETDDGYLLQVPNNMFFQRPVVRKVGDWRIRLADQLYEPRNATGEQNPADNEEAAARHAA